MSVRLTSVILLSVCSFWAHGQTPFLQEEIPAQLEVHISPEKLSHTLDSASWGAFVKFHARYFETRLGSDSALTSGRDHYWHLRSPGLALKAYLQISLNRVDTLYVYNHEKELREIIHTGNHFQKIWISEVYDQEVYLRYRNNSRNEPQVLIEGYSLQLLPSNRFKKAGFGDSDFCEINVNCAEGDGYRDEQKSVVRINIKLGGFEGWCTGTLVNTTDHSFKPYFITAEHCGISPSSTFVSAADLNRWEFYFNYESADCSTPPSEGSIPIIKITGATLLARSDDNGGDFGSDFMLLTLNDETSFSQLNNPYFAGWDHADKPPMSGVTIHHPQGDIKKISTFTSPASSSEFGTTVEDTHWEVTWSSTTTGFGVTEPGSSGAPLFNSNGLVKGMLTGGLATCTNPGDPDYYGKFSYSWDRNGGSANRRLEPWLDPINKNPIALGGAFRGDPTPVDSNNFSVTPVPVLQGELLVKGLGTQKSLVELQIFSVAGELVYISEVAPVPNEVVRIDVSGFKSGIYFIKILRDEGSNTFKFNIINQ